MHWKGEFELDATWERDVTLWQFDKEVTKYLRKQQSMTASTSSSGVCETFSLGPGANALASSLSLV